MKKSTAVLVGSSLLLMGATCSAPESPPNVVEVDRAVEVPCRIPEPECSAPLFDRAQKEQPGDVKLGLLRAEGRLREDCLRRYREVLKACRTPSN